MRWLFLLGGLIIFTEIRLAELFPFHINIFLFKRSSTYIVDIRDILIYKHNTNFSLIFFLLCSYGKKNRLPGF